MRDLNTTHQSAIQKCAAVISIRKNTNIARHLCIRQRNVYNRAPVRIKRHEYHAPFTRDESARISPDKSSPPTRDKRVSVQTRAPVRIKRRKHRARCSYAQQRNGHCHPPSFSIVHPQQKRKRASRHHGGAARGKMGTTCRFEPRKKLSRFPTQFRGDQTRQRVKGGSAAPNAAVNKRRNCGPAVAKTAGAVEVFGA